MTDKVYINGISIKEVQGQFGTFFNISLNLEKLVQYQNEKGYVNITASKRKEPSQYGETHSCVLNEYKPSEKKEKKNDDEISIEDLPF